MEPRGNALLRLFLAGSSGLHFCPRNFGRDWELDS
jgi:hypothetical protein